MKKLFAGIIGATLIGMVAVYVWTGGGVLTFASAIRSVVRAPGDWFDAYVNWWGSSIITRLLLIIICAFLFSLKDEEPEEVGREMVRRLTVGLVVYALGVDMWFGQFGVEGVFGSAWRPRDQWPIYAVDIVAVVSMFFALTIWSWSEARSRAVKYAGLGIVLFAGVALWLWPETIETGVAIAIGGPIIVAMGILAMLSRVHGHAGVAKMLLEEPTPSEEALRPERGPHAPTEHRSI